MIEVTEAFAKTVLKNGVGAVPASAVFGRDEGKKAAVAGADDQDVLEKMDAEALRAYAKTIKLNVGNDFDRESIAAKIKAFRAKVATAAPPAVDTTSAEGAVAEADK
jgi:hypothetical protein